MCRKNKKKKRKKASSFCVAFSDNLDLGTCLDDKSWNMGRFCLHFATSTLKKEHRGVKKKEIHCSIPWLQHLWIKSGAAGDASRENSPDSRWGSSGSCGRVFLFPSAAPLQQLPASHREQNKENKCIWQELKLWSSQDSSVYTNKMFLSCLVAQAAVCKVHMAKIMNG